MKDRLDCEFKALGKDRTSIAEIMRHILDMHRVMKVEFLDYESDCEDPSESDDSSASGSSSICSERESF